MIMLYWLAAILKFSTSRNSECLYCSLLCIVFGTILAFPKFCVIIFWVLSLSLFLNVYYSTFCFT